MPYIHVTGTFTISAEDWSFDQWIPTKVENIGELTEQDDRTKRHVSIYWEEIIENLGPEAYNFETTNVEIVPDELAPPEVIQKSLNRVEAWTRYSIDRTGDKAQHKPGYEVDVVTNEQANNWVGDHPPAESRQYPEWLARGRQLSSDEKKYS